jgi:hypothetical protein
MSDEILTANAEADQSSVAKTNMSVGEFANRRLGEMTAQKEEPQEVQPDEVTEEPVEEQTEEQPQEVEQPEATQEQSDDVLSQYNLDTMSEEELQELSEKLGSRAVARYGELTAKRKAAEERLAALEEKLKEKQDPLQASQEVKDNPFSNLVSVKELQEKATEVSQVVEWAEDVLFESDAYAADDVVTEVDGKELTKSDVRKALQQARKAQKTFLPDQLKKVQAIENGKHLEVGFKKQAEQELTWLTGEDNDTRKMYESVVGDDRFLKLKEVLRKEAPDIAGQLDYWFAHGVNSLYGRKPVEGTKKSVTINPPKTGIPSSSSPDKRSNPTAKALKDLQARYKESGDLKDFAAMRKLQMSKS